MFWRATDEFPKYEFVQDETRLPSCVLDTEYRRLLKGLDFKAAGKNYTEYLERNKALKKKALQERKAQ